MIGNPNNNPSDSVAAKAGNPNQSVPEGFDSNHPHLLVDTAQQLGKSVEERIQHIAMDKFVLHDAAKRVLGAMKEVLILPKGVRPPCLAVIGGSNQGKSATTKRFLRDYDADFTGYHLDMAEVPILSVEMPPRATEPRLCLAIARALGLTGYSNAKSRVVSDNVYRALKQKCVRLVIFNEAQHALNNSRLERSVVCDFIKGISNLGISVIAVGTEDALTLFAEDEQVSNRMRVERLTPFNNNSAAFTDFLHAIEAHYPLPQPSGLGSKPMAAEIYKRTLGNTGEVVMLCNAAAMLAVQTGAPCIDLPLLRKTVVRPTAKAA